MTEERSLNSGEAIIQLDTLLKFYEGSDIKVNRETLDDVIKLLTKLSNFEVNEGDGWTENVEYLLKNCPYTIRVREGGGPEDLLSSLVVTFQHMQHLLQQGK